MPSPLPNSLPALEERAAAGRFGWKGPVFMLFARLVLALLAQALVAGLFALRGHPSPWEASAPWFTVYGTLIDIGCLVALWRLTRREGLGLFDLVRTHPIRPGADVLLGLGYLVVYLLVGGVGGAAIGFLIYGAPPAAPMGGLPLWGALYSVLVWPVLWGFTEQLLYNGYALPRLEVLSRRAWVPIALVVFFWTVQHVTLPLRFDAQFMLYRALSPLPAVGLMVVLFLRQRRLLPLIVAHMLVDALSALSGFLAQG
ncbi:type II CAAX prenyl endopeptidase Rce1 family protein [Archangium sp.]|jgi:hypothetical protein|uniref:CPBP family glutamic-type intramembrane protease n=1 Tax=Archangium sp. TaxID=1872627 RepID=UPI002EDB354E